jgi:hypothetical protein
LPDRVLLVGPGLPVALVIHSIAHTLATADWHLLVLTGVGIRPGASLLLSPLSLNKQVTGPEAPRAVRRAGALLQRGTPFIVDPSARSAHGFVTDVRNCEISTRPATAGPACGSFLSPRCGDRSRGHRGRPVSRACRAMAAL